VFRRDVTSTARVVGTAVLLPDTPRNLHAPGSPSGASCGGSASHSSATAWPRARRRPALEQIDWNYAEEIHRAGCAAPSGSPAPTRGTRTRPGHQIAAARAAEYRKVTEQAAPPRGALPVPNGTRAVGRLRGRTAGRRLPAATTFPPPDRPPRPGRGRRPCRRPRTRHGEAPVKWGHRSPAIHIDLPPPPRRLRLADPPSHRTWTRFVFRPPPPPRSQRRTPFDKSARLSYPSHHPGDCIFRDHPRRYSSPTPPVGKSPLSSTKRPSNDERYDAPEAPSSTVSPSAAVNDRAPTRKPLTCTAPCSTASTSTTAAPPLLGREPA